MELTGKILTVLPPVSGESSKGGWTKQEILIEHGEKFPKKALLTIFGKDATERKYGEGKVITVEFDPESREYNGKYYTDLNVWKIVDLEEDPF